MPDLNQLRDMVFDGDNAACFIERDSCFCRHWQRRIILLRKN